MEGRIDWSGRLVGDSNIGRITRWDGGNSNTGYGEEDYSNNGGIIWWVGLTHHGCVV